jgi:hypothetical protein
MNLNCNMLWQGNASQLFISFTNRPVHITTIPEAGSASI